MVLAFSLFAEDAIIEIEIVLTEIETETTKDLVIIGANHDIPLSHIVNKLLLLLPLHPLNLTNRPPPPLLQPPNKTLSLEAHLLMPAVVIISVMHH